MIILTATLQAKTGKEETLKQALLGMIPATAKEKGVKEYRFHKSTTDPGRFFFYEKYADQEALDSHMDSAHFKATVATISDMVAKEPELTAYEFIQGIPE